MTEENERRVQIESPVHGKAVVDALAREQFRHDLTVGKLNDANARVAELEKRDGLILVKCDSCGDTK